MRLTFTKRNLTAGLNAVAPYISKKHAIPILANVRIDAERWGDPIRFCTTNLEVAAEVEVEGELDHTGSVCVDIAQLKEMIKSVKPSDSVCLMRENAHAFKVITGEWIRTLAWQPVADFPKVGTRKRVKCYGMSGDQFRAGLASVYGASNEDTRYFLRGVHLDCRADRTIFVATDGRRLALKECKPFSDFDDPFAVTLPSDAVRSALKLFKRSKRVRFGVKDNQFWVKSSGLVFSSRVLECDYPKWEKIIEQDTKRDPATFWVSVDRSAMLEAVERLMKIKCQLSVNRPNESSIHFDVGHGVLKMNVRSKDTDESDEVEIPVSGANGHYMELAFSGHYWRDTLKNASAAELDITFQSPISACFVHPKDDPTQTDLIMPMRREKR